MPLIKLNRTYRCRDNMDHHRCPNSRYNNFGISVDHLLMIETGVVSLTFLQTEQTRVAVDVQRAWHCLEARRGGSQV